MSQSYLVKMKKTLIHRAGVFLLSAYAHSTIRQGVDYSFDRPSPSGMINAGYDFVIRYVSPRQT